MPRVIGSSQVIHQHLTTNTSQGEVTINLNLTITINQDGTVQVAAAKEQSQQSHIEEKQIPDSIYAIPEFESTELLHGFGEDTSR